MKKVIRGLVAKIDGGRLEYLISLGVYSVPFSLRLLNFIVQRIFRINGSCPWPVNYTSVVLAPNKIKLGKGVGRYVAASRGCYITGFNGVIIGDGTLIGPGVGLISANHDLADRSQTKEAPIKIGKNCWLGMNAIVLPGVTLGDNVTVGAGAIVTKSFPDNSIIAGNPASVIAKVNSKDDRNKD